MTLFEQKIEIVFEFPILQGEVLPLSEGLDMKQGEQEEDVDAELEALAMECVSFYDGFWLRAPSYMLTILHNGITASAW